VIRDLRPVTGNFYLRFEFLTTMKIVMFFWDCTPSVDSNVSEKLTVSIFSTKGGDVMCLSPSSELKVETVCSSETLASTDESTRRQNPEEQYRQEISKSEPNYCQLRLYHVWTIIALVTCLYTVNI
jgi:hypothetical protein